MAPSSKPQYHLDLGHLPPLVPKENRSASSTAASSPIEAGTSSSTRPSQGGSGALAGALNNTSSTRIGAGSPSHDYGSRLYSRRARELQASEGMGHIWGPPTASGLSTPLRETIPESPGDDTFPDLGTSTPDSGLPMRSSSTRRARAGTVPSKFSSGVQVPGLPHQSQTSRSSRPTPSTSPFRPGTSSLVDDMNSSSPVPSSILLSRIRAGSMPQRSTFLGSSSPFGQSVFSSNYTGSGNRLRSSTLATTSSNSPPPSALRESFGESGINTLDYLGLVDTPQQQQQQLRAASDMFGSSSNPALQPLLSGLTDFNNRNRFRSYSVNAKEKYAEEEDDLQQAGYYSGTLTPSAEAAQAALAATQAQIHQHNLEVQAFANQSSSSRPRARTAGVLDSPSSRLWRNQYPGGPPSYQLEDPNAYNGLSEAVKAMQLQNTIASTLDGISSEEATRALWLGSIPASTTTSSLKVIFDPYGKIESARVLTHKSCGFVNFESLESAVRAKSQLNGKEIFPGAGPIRIGYAKAPGTPGQAGANGVYPSSSPDPFGPTQEEKPTVRKGSSGVTAKSSEDTTIRTPLLEEIKDEIVDIVEQFGATNDECIGIASQLDQALMFESYTNEILSISEPSHNRMYDAPKLREIRKRIDNQSCPPMEIEEIALSMLPEVAELASDYLGNTVVQKLFEHCSAPTKEAMLREIAPHLAEIGVHKNGTWAAQKIIDVANTPMQKNMIVESLRPYGVALFLDQYGNYVMQCCLKFGSPWNNFIFEVMLNKLWEMAQGRFGARAMRACLESHHATRDQQRMLAAAIALNSVQLATNANGALLLTWFLDTCTFPNRRAVLAPRLVPRLVHLCTHKVAYLTVLKIINQRNEPEARDTILQALFFSEDNKVLEDILRDQSCGATLIFKILTTPFFDDQIRTEVVDNIRKVLTQLKAQPAQGYKRLMDEVGLSTRNSSTNNRESGHGNRNDTPSGPKSAGRPGSSTSQPNHQSNGSMFPTMPNQPPGLNHAVHRNGNPEANAMMAQYNVAEAHGSSPQPFSTTVNQPPGHVPYQHGMMAGNRIASPYGFGSPVMNGYPTAPPVPIDAYRNIPRGGMQQSPAYAMGSSPMMPPPGYGQPGFNPMMGMNSGTPGMWQQYPNAYMMPSQQLQGQQAMNGSPGGGGGGGAGGRRGRR